MGRTQCQAFAKRTQTQCTNNAMRGTSYCWIHYPKKEPIELFILGVLLTFLFQIGRDFFTTSPEEKKIIELRQDIQKYQDENNRLKAIINQQRVDSFDLFPDPNSGIRLYSRRSAVSMHYKQALDLYKEGRLVDAKDTLEMILQKRPNDVKTLNLLGIILNELGNVEDALKCLNRAYELSRNPDILNNIEVIKYFPGRKINTKEID